MSKNRYHRDFTRNQLSKGLSYMLEEIKVAPEEYQKALVDVFFYYWDKFMMGDFAVDGATFIDEEKGCFFNVWWFIHDGRNSEGFVGAPIDNEMIDIMTLTNTPAKFYKQSIPWFKLTWLNRVRHWFKGSLKSDLPTNLIVIYE